MLKVSSPVIHKSTFVPFAGVVVHTMRIGGGMSGRNYPMACALSSQVIQMFDLLVLTDAHAELRMRDQAAGMPVNLFERATWVLWFLTSLHLVGWVNEPKEGVIPPRSTDTSRIRFACMQILYLVCNLLTMDVLNSWAFAEWSWVDAEWMGLAVCECASTRRSGVDGDIDLAHRTWVLTLLCTGRWMPCDLPPFPPMFAPMGNAYTLRRLWGYAHSPLSSSLLV